MPSRVSRRPAAARADRAAQRGSRPGNVGRGWAPASVANFLHGFDVAGLALRAPRCRVEVRSAERDRALVHDGGAWREVPVREAIAHDAARRAAALVRRRGPLEVRVRSDVPRGVGLGSSAAMAVAAAKAVRDLVGGRGLAPAAWCRAAFEAERAFGGDHWDNVQPAFYGGLTVRHPDEPDRCRVRAAPRLRFVLAVPPPTVRRVRRAALPRSVARADLVRALAAAAWGHGSGPRATFDDLRPSFGYGVVERARARAVPYYPRARDAAARLGAATFVSGGGPTLAAACPDLAVAARVRRAWQPLAARGVRLLEAAPLAPLRGEAAP